MVKHSKEDNDKGTDLSKDTHEASVFVVPFRRGLLFLLVINFSDCCN